MKHLDLFSGYGGFTIPGEKYGIETVAFSEIDKYACSVLNYHYPNIKNYGDITKIKGEDLPSIDIVTGGSPCQDLSVAGKGAGLNGARSGLFFHFIRLIKEKQPTYFIWENVKGALSSSKGWDFARVQIEMEQAGYDVWWQTLNAKDFGVPQNRERIFAVGIRKGSGREVLFEQTNSGQDVNKIIDTGHEATNVYGTDGLAPTQKALGGGLGAKTGLYYVGSVDIVANKRVYNTPVEINEYLKKYKVGTNKEIAEKLGIPITQVEHYFRTDSSRAIPSPELWLRLKEILGFDDKFDKQVTEYYEKQVEFESTRRVYSSEGVAKTTDTSGTGLYAIDSSKIKGFKEKEDVANALTATCYKGYGNDGVTVIASDKEITPTQIGNSKKFGNASGGESAYTLRASEPNRVVETARVTPMRWSRNEKGREARKKAKEALGKDYTPFSGGHRELVESKDDISGCITNALNKDSLLRQETRIRRLTPTEAERLMGLEDGWTAKGIMDDKEVDISDTQRYKMCGNGVVVNCVDYIYSLICNNNNNG